GPGANDLLNDTGTNATWSGKVNPIRVATSAATAPSYPSPLVGSLNSNSEPSEVPPSHQGGKAGLPVPIVSVPWSLKASAFAAAQSAAVEAAVAPVAPVAAPPVPPIVGLSSAQAANSREPTTRKANTLRICGTPCRVKCASLAHACSTAMPVP